MLPTGISVNALALAPEALEASKRAPAEGLLRVGQDC